MNAEKFKEMKPKQIFLSYREMCDYLEEPFLKDNSKDAQIKEWRRYAKFSVRKNKSIEINEIYNNPIEKVDKRKDGNNVVYTSLVQLILLDYLSKNIDIEDNKPYINLSKTQMYQIIGMCNETYVKEFIQKYRQDYKHVNEIAKFKSENNLSDYDMFTYYERSSTKFNAILNSALSSLKSKSVIIVTDNYIVKDIPDTIANNKLKSEINRLLEKGRLSRTELNSLMNKFEKTEQRLATLEEKSAIVEITRLTLDKLGLKDLFFAYKPYNVDSFSKELNIRFLHEMNWSMCYKTKTISFTDKTINSGVKIIEKEIEVIKAKRRELNHTIKDALDNRAIVVYNKTKDGLVERILDDETIFTYKDNYVDAQRVISNFFMNIEEEEEEQ